MMPVLIYYLYSALLMMHEMKCNGRVSEKQ